jgi:hypothetical protein
MKSGDFVGRRSFMRAKNPCRVESPVYNIPPERAVSLMGNLDDYLSA